MTIATNHCLLDHLRTERGPLRYEDLVCDCARLPHLPQSEAVLRDELRALQRAGLVTWANDNWVQATYKAEATGQMELFG